MERASGWETYLFLRLGEKHREQSEKSGQDCWAAQSEKSGQDFLGYVLITEKSVNQ
jgi:hypothetical protein